MAEYETQRLVLRRPCGADADDLFALDQDPRVMRFLNGGTPTPRAEFESRNLPPFVSARESKPGRGFWLAHDKSAGSFVGWFSLRGETDCAELGYRLVFSSWGKGLATEGSERILAAGFETGGVQRVIAQTYEDNWASRAVLTKLGLTLHRRFRYTQGDLERSTTTFSAAKQLWDGDDLEFVMTRDEWQDKQKGQGQC